MSAPSKSFPLHDERLRPDDLLGRTEPDRDAQQFRSPRIAEPIVVDLGDAIPRFVDDVHEPFDDPGLGQPVRVTDLGPVSGSLQGREGLIAVPLASEDVHILGVSFNVGERPRVAAHQVGNTRLVEYLERPDVEMRVPWSSTTFSGCTISPS